MSRLFLAGLLAVMAFPAEAAASLDGFVAAAKAGTPRPMAPPPGSPTDVVTLTAPAPRRVKVLSVRRGPDGAEKKVAVILDLEPLGDQIRVNLATGLEGAERPALACITRLDAAGKALAGDCWAAAAFASRGAAPASAKLLWTITATGSTIRVERGAQVILALDPAGPSFQTRFTAALKAVSAYAVTEEPGILIGEATAAGHTIPLVSVRVSDVRDGSFRLTRKMLFGPPEQAETSWDFRVAGPGGNADDLRYAVTQTQVSAAGQPRVATECLARRASSGAVSMQCFRPEIAKLGPGIAQPSFTFAFRPWPLFEIDIGPGLDNIFTVKAGSEFRTPKA